MEKEIYEELSKDYERQLYTAKELAYVSFKNINHKQRLAQIYEIIFHKKSGIMNGCGRCALRDTREIAEIYYRVQKELEPKEVKTVDNQAVKEIKPKKRATKKNKEKDA